MDIKKRINTWINIPTSALMCNVYRTGLNKRKKKDDTRSPCLDDIIIWSFRF